MLKEVQVGNTILISGPASATRIEGKVSVLGRELIDDEKIIVRKGKSLPLEAEENSILDIVLGAEAEVYEVEGSTIPGSWGKAVEEALSQEKPCTVMVLGDMDSGKTSFSTFLINKTLKAEFKPAIVDVDLGQSDIGPPTSIGFSVISEPIVDLFSVKPAAIFFTGRTSSSGITQRVISGLESIMKQIPEGSADLTVVNTDGWVKGDGARSYKAELIRNVCPDAVVGIQRSEELEPLLQPIEEEGFKVLRILASPALKRRGRKERRELREQSFKKYLGKPTLRSIHMNWIALEHTPIGLGNALDPKRVETLEKALRCRIVYCEESSKELYIVVDEREKVDEESVSAAESLFQKNLYVVRDGEEEGLLVCLLDKKREFLGLGVIYKLDYKNRNLKIHTSYKDDISIIQFGEVKINGLGNELETTTSFSIKDQIPR